MIRLARWVSIVAHPFAMVALVVTVAGVRQGAGEAARGMSLVALFVILPGTALMVRQVRRGAWGNVDASDRSERPLLYAVGGAGLLAMLGYQLLVDPGSFLFRGTVGALGMVAVCAAATRWVKVSLHLAAAALAATTLVLLGSPVGWAAAAVVPALAWSRLALGRHTLLEVALGAAIGIAAGVAIHAH